MSDELHKKFLNDTAAALQRSQQVARERCEQFGTPFLANTETRTDVKYSSQQPDSALVQETPDAVDGEET